ncbi:MAG: tetratricopeptide repeat protein [Planctomycetota bacterium]
MTQTGLRGTGAQGRGVLVGSLFCFAFLLALYPLQSYDTWWHLANGREIAAGRGIPRTNLYSFTEPDYEVTPTHWLFGLGSYCLHAAAGVNGLVVAKALLVAAAFTLAFGLARRRGAGGLAAAAVVALGVLASRRRFLERPHLFTMLGLAGFAYLIQIFRERFDESCEVSPEDATAEGGRAARALGVVFTRRNWPVLALPPLAALWANLHAGCLFGVGLVGMAAAGEFVIWLARWAKLGRGALETRTAARMTLALSAATFACAIFVMLSPVGWGVYTYNLWHVGLAEVVPLKEFRAATPLDQPVFYLLMMAGAGALVFDRARTRAGDAIAFGVFALLGIYAVRGIPNFALVAAPVMAPALTRAWGKLRASPRLGVRVGPYVRRTALVLDRLPPTAVSLSIIVFPFLATFASGKYEIALGVEPGLVPERAAEFVEREVAHERAVFNDLAAGGYLAWRWYPKRRIFIDGRTNAYPPELFRALYTGPVTRAVVERVFDYHDVNIALIFHYGGGNPLWPVFDLDEWAVIHADETALVVARRIAANRALIDKHEPTLGAEAEAVLSKRLAERGRGDAARAARAAARGDEAMSKAFAARGRKADLAAAGAAERALKAEAAPGGRTFSERRRAALNFRMGVGAVYIGEAEAAAGMYEKALTLRPDFTEARLNLGHVRLKLGKPDLARREFERALELAPGKPEALYGLARSFEELGLRDEARSAYRRFIGTGAGGAREVEKAKAFLESAGAGRE